MNGFNGILDIAQVENLYMIKNKLLDQMEKNCKEIYRRASYNGQRC